MAILLAVLMLMGAACSITDETTITAPALDDGTAPTDTIVAPTGDTATPPTDTPASTNPTIESTTPVISGDQDFSGDQESAESSPFTYEYPEFMLINRNDRSTPLGKLCWAFWEYASNESARIDKVLADNTPNFEVTYPAIADITEGEDNGVGPVGVINEESNEPSIGTDGYLIDSLEEIREPSIAGIVDDPGLSKELQLFAKALFAYIEVFEAQIRAVGYENFDRTRLPYQDFMDMPHAKEFNDAAIANPDKCVIPSEEETNRFYNDLDAKIEKYLEEKGGPVTIE